MIRPMTTADIDRVVAVHVESFPGFFLSFLGPGFLRRYYAGIVAAPEGIAFVWADAGGQVAGFVAGSANPGGFYRRLLRRDWLGFCFASLPAVCRRPSVVPRLFRALSHPGANPVGADVAGLFSIAVAPSTQGSGAGGSLVRAFLDEAGRRGAGKVFLTTDRDDNDGVNAFYRNLGFSLERQYLTPEGRRMNEYWICL